MLNLLLYPLIFSALLLQADHAENPVPAPIEGPLTQQAEKSLIDYDGTIVEEKVPFQKQLNFFKSTKGKLAGYLATSRTASKIMGWAQSNKGLLTMNWKNFIEKHNINMDEYVIPENGYATFNDFFARKLKPGARTIDQTPGVIVSPADSKCTFVSDISKKDIFIIKNSKWSLSRMLMSRLLAEIYDGGTLISFRLSPEDYHRFHFPFDAKPGFSKKITGKYHSVNPYVFKLGEDPFGENARNVLVLKSEEFCDPLCIIVGAMGVGKIVETYTPETLYKKGEEMGYFKFGASTVCLLFRKGVIKPAYEKFVTNSQSMIETAVKQGQRIAIITNHAETAAGTKLLFDSSTFVDLLNKIKSFYITTKNFFTKFSLR